MNHFKDHKIVVSWNHMLGWMTEMQDHNGRVLGEQFFDPALDKQSVVSRARTIATWFGITVEVEDT